MRLHDAVEDVNGGLYDRIAAAAGLYHVAILLRHIFHIVRGTELGV